MKKDEYGQRAGGPGSAEDQLEAVREEERKRIARDVHDELGGDLAAIKMALAVLGRRLPPDDGLRKQLAYVDGLVDGAIDSMHRMIDRWQEIPSGTLQDILRQQAAAFSRQSGVMCQCVLADMPLCMDTPAARALARIVRECLTNIGKHAQASRVRVGLRATDAGLILEVEDDGVGLKSDHAIDHIIDHTAARPGLGIRGMRQRVGELGGEFSMRAAAPHGTLVVVELPLENVRT